MFKGSQWALKVTIDSFEICYADHLSFSFLLENDVLCSLKQQQNSSDQFLSHPDFINIFMLLTM